MSALESASRVVGALVGGLVGEADLRTAQVRGRRPVGIGQVGRQLPDDDRAAPAGVTRAKELARTGAREHVGHDARVRAADEQHRRMLPLRNQPLELTAQPRKRAAVKAP